jgi:hypothetical protein
MRDHQVLGRGQVATQREDCRLGSMVRVLER